VNVLVTGATGFLGAELIRAMLDDSRITRIFALVRSSHDQSSADRMTKLISYWARFDVKPQGGFDKISIVDFDLQSSVDLPRLDSIDVVIHCAAATDLRLSLSEARSANLRATQRALEIARTSPNLKRFVHLSTAFVSGKLGGVIDEKDRAVRFFNNYEKTKLEAEDCVKASDLPFTILRPSVIVGSSRTGYTSRFKVVYSVWRMWLAGLVPRAPIDRHARVDMVPSDFVTQAALALAFDPRAAGETLHLCAGEDAVAATDVLESARDVFAIKYVPTVPMWVAWVWVRWPLRLIAAHGLQQIIHVMKWQVPYLGTRGRVFSMVRTRAMLLEHGIKCPVFAEYGRTMFEFCRDTSWGKRPRPGLEAQLTASAAIQTLGKSDKESALVFS